MDFLNQMDGARLLNCFPALKLCKRKVEITEMMCGDFFFGRFVDFVVVLLVVIAHITDFPSSSLQSSLEYLFGFIMRKLSQ